MRQTASPSSPPGRFRRLIASWKYSLLSIDAGWPTVVHEPKTSSPGAATTDKTSSNNKIEVATKTVRHISRLQLIAVAFIGILLIVMASLGVYLRQRALIGTHLAGQSAQGMTMSELVASATNSAQAIKINLKGAKQTTVARLVELGVKVDAQATAKAAMEAKRGGLAPLAFWDSQNVPLIYKLDEQVFAAYMQKHFNEEWLPPQNATISFNAESKTFDVVAGIPGKGSNLSQFRQALDAAMAKPGIVNLTITPTPIAPKVSNSAAETAKKQADTFLTSDITMLRGGQVVFTLEPQEIATLLDITADATRGTISVNPNGDKVQAFVDGPIQNTVNRAARDQVVVVDPNTHAESIIQAGASGITLADRPALSTSITTALREHKPLAVELSVTQSPFASKTISGSGRWIDVNLSSQTATLFIDNTVFASYVISSGRAATPTNVGEFYIRSKYPIQTMSGTINGEYYNVPNIPWVSYFNSDGEAFHGTYWHSNFGTPMSHGCINMRIEDAKVVYDFAPIGTRVTVHY